MFSRIFSIVVVVSLVATMVSLYNSGEEKREVRELEEAAAALKKTQIREQLQADVSSLQESTGATDGWLSELVGEENIRINEVLTYELQKLWVGDAPILFEGTIIDIESISDMEYQITIKMALPNHSGLIIVSPLYLRLNSKKIEIDNILKSNPEVVGLLSSTKKVVVAASVSKIEKYDNLDQEAIGKVGIGELLGVVYVGSSW